MAKSTKEYYNFSKKCINYEKKYVTFSRTRSCLDCMRNLKKYNAAELFTLASMGKKTARAAFEELYDRYSGQIYKYALKILGDPELASDILQDTFLRLYKSVKKEIEITNFDAFIFKIARNLCLTSKNDKYKNLLNIEDIILVSQDENFAKKEMLELIKTAVESLPDKLKDAFVLKEYNGLAYQEIADVLDVPLSTVKMRIFRARKNIQTILSPIVKEFEKNL